MANPSGVRMNVGPMKYWEQAIRDRYAITWVEPSIARSVNPSLPKPLAERIRPVVFLAFPPLVLGIFLYLSGVQSAWVFVVLLAGLGVVGYGVCVILSRAMTRKEIWLFSDAIVRRTKFARDPVDEVFRYSDIKAVRVFGVHDKENLVPMIEIIHLNDTAMILGGSPEIGIELLSEHFQKHGVAIQ